MIIKYISDDGKKEFFAPQISDGTWCVCSRNRGNGNIDVLLMGIANRTDAEKALVKYCEEHKHKLNSGHKRAKIIIQAVEYEEKARECGAVSLITMEYGRVIDMALYQFETIDVDLEDKEDFRFVCYKNGEITAVFYVEPQKIISADTEVILFSSGLLQTFSIKRNPPKQK